MDKKYHKVILEACTVLTWTRYFDSTVPLNLNAHLPPPPLAIILHFSKYLTRNKILNIRFLYTPLYCSRFREVALRELARRGWQGWAKVLDSNIPPVDSSIAVSWIPCPWVSSTNFHPLAFLTCLSIPVKWKINISCIKLNEK